MTLNDRFSPKTLFVLNIVPSAALNKQLFTSLPAAPFMCAVAISAVAYLHARRKDCFTYSGLDQSFSVSVKTGSNHI